MTNLAVVGAQWGDEGKGKIVDLLSERFDVVARFQGGPNAGHTVTIGGRRHALHHVPSGVFRPSVSIVIGNGTVLDLRKLIEELDGLEAAGVALEGRLFISDRAHVILPPLARVDAMREAAAGERDRIGTTQRGIGPTYEAKAARFGVRLAECADEEALARRIERILVGSVGKRLRDGGENPGEPRSLAREVQERWRRLSPYVADTAILLNDWIDAGRSVLFEGAQGTLLDLDHGSYPFVTSSSTVAGGACGGLGIAPRHIHRTLGVFKAYATRVGAGPMPTELEDGPEGIGAHIRRRGKEFGTTTGRPRRCGWFDAVSAAHACRINRFDAACIMLLDVLDELEEIRICTGYTLEGSPLRALPPVTTDAERVQPIFETLPGWRSDTSEVRRWEDLPAAARSYVDRLGALVGTEILVVSVGPDREQSVLRPGTALARDLGL